MIDYSQLLFNALWVLGFALILTAVSFAQFELSQRSEKLLSILKRPGYSLVIYFGFMLICLGFFLKDPRWLIKILWGGLALLASIQFFGYRRGITPDSKDDSH